MGAIESRGRFLDSIAFVYLKVKEGTSMKKIQPITIDVNKTDWLSIFKQPISKRNNYIHTDEQLTYTQVVGKCLGTYLDTDEYFTILYDLSTEKNIYNLSETLDKSISPERFQAVQKLLLVNQSEGGLSVNRFIAFMHGEQLISSGSTLFPYEHIREKIRLLFLHFRENHANGFLHPDFRRFLVDITKWQFNHLEKWLKEEDVPKVMWYGEANSSEQYFLYFLILIGCDILLFHPEGKDVLPISQDKNCIYMYPTTAKLTEFPTSQPVRKGTVAFQASQEINSILHSDDSMLYKPWQFNAYAPRAITLKTTYDELFLLMKELAFIRPNFKVENNTVHIPAVFSKVSGISRNKKSYWERIQKLCENELTLLIKTAPFTEEVTGNNQYHYQNALGRNGLDPEKMVVGNWWIYKELPTGLQYGLASAISRYCANPKLKLLVHENTQQLQMYLFNQALHVRKDVLMLLQRFDYSQQVPRIIIYHNEKSGTFQRSDAALLALISEIGFDIVLYNPTGQNDLEQYVEESYYDLHLLEDRSFNEEFQEESSFKKLFKKLF